MTVYAHLVFNLKAKFYNWLAWLFVCLFLVGNFHSWIFTMTINICQWIMVYLRMPLNVNNITERNWLPCLTQNMVGQCNLQSSIMIENAHRSYSFIHSFSKWWNFLFKNECEWKCDSPKNSEHGNPNIWFNEHGDIRSGVNTHKFNWIECKKCNSFTEGRKKWAICHSRWAWPLMNFGK